MPLGYWIFGGLLLLAVAAANAIDDRAPKWVTQVAAVGGAVCWAIALCVLILRIP